MNEISRIGVDTSKLFQLHGVDAAGQAVLRRQLSRAQVERFFARLPPTLIGLEACGAAHHWARVLRAQGHAVRLIPPQYVKPYVKRGKNDRIDAEAIREALSRPSMRFVPVKEEAEQAALMLLKTRDLLIKQRTMLGNAIRGRAAEFGVVEAKGMGRVATLVERARDAVPPLAYAMLETLSGQLAELEARLRQIEVEIMAWHKKSETSRRLATIPGVGRPPP